MIRIGDDTVYGAYLHTLGLIKKSDTLGAQIRIDNIRFSFADGLIGTFGNAGSAGYAFIGN